MRNPLERLKYLPWRSLLQVAGLTMLIVAAVELLLVGSIALYPLLLRPLNLLLSPPLGMIVSFALATGMGCLAVYIAEGWHGFALNASTLWALAFCLLLGLFLKSLLPLPLMLVGFSQLSFIAAVVGIFWKGRPYWR